MTTYLHFSRHQSSRPLSVDVRLLSCFDTYAELKIQQPHFRPIFSHPLIWRRISGRRPIMPNPAFIGGGWKEISQKKGSLPT
jgi:hypothetical protein